MRRLVLTAHLSLDGFLGSDDLDRDWARAYDDDHLTRYHRRIALKAGVLADGGDWTVEALLARAGDGDPQELAPIVVRGGPELFQELTRRGLVDEYRLTVHPVVLGEGDRLFTVTDRLLNISTRHFAKGSVAYVLVPESKYRDRPPPLPWAVLAGSEGSGEDQDDPEP